MTGKSWSKNSHQELVKSSLNLKAPNQGQQWTHQQTESGWFTLWWTYKKQWKITIFSGKIHYFYGHFQLLFVSSPEGSPYFAGKKPSFVNPSINLAVAEPRSGLGCAGPGAFSVWVLSGPWRPHGGPSISAVEVDIWVWVKIRYPNNWMVNTKLD